MAKRATTDACLMWLAVAAGLVLLLVPMIVIFFGRKSGVSSETKAASAEGGCSMSAGVGCSDNPDLDPIMEASYNAQQMVKQSILLEDHLNQPRKRCKDCICKHMMTLSALSEEAVSLAKTDEDERLMQDAALFYDRTYKEWKSGKEPTEVASELRDVRKQLMARYL